MSAPALPTASKTRWQPLRLGLVDMFRYDSEEFWFHDGHLLLRGNNGTGKSKVLSLTLPLLFDANLRPARVEPDGDPAKKMAWNLLLGEAYERRTGYSWIEFGRVGEDGQARYLTLGLGLHAVAARAQQLDAWYFVAEAAADGPRLGRDWWLVSDRAPVPGREALRQMLGEGSAGQGQVFDQAQAYRRAVDERLFRLGARRYEALLDTLIQLRQPQLSRRPDEKLLSAALTESLPPLPPELLADVADALGQLEELRAELERAQRLLKAVDAFDARYRVYAGLASRRQARGLRQAQTEFDNASRGLHAARDRFDQAQAAEVQARQRQANAHTLLGGARQRQETLLADPRHADARQLHEAAQQARQLDQDRARAELDAQQAQARAEREATLLAQTQQALDRARRQPLEARSEAGTRATAAGLPAALHEHPYMALHEEALGALAPEPARRELLAWPEHRREDLRLIRQRLSEAHQARDRLLPLRQTLADRRADVEEAAARHAAAEADLQEHGQAHEQAWALHLSDLQALVVPQSDAVLQALADWVRGPEAEHPARAALRQAQSGAATEIAQARAALAAQRLDAQTEVSSLASEVADLQRGSAPPPRPRPGAARPHASRARPAHRCGSWWTSTPPWRPRSAPASKSRSGAPACSTPGSPLTVGCCRPAARPPGSTRNGWRGPPARRSRCPTGCGRTPPRTVPFRRPPSPACWLPWPARRRTIPRPKPGCDPTAASVSAAWPGPRRWTKPATSATPRAKRRASAGWRRSRCVNRNSPPSWNGSTRKPPH